MFRHEMDLVFISDVALAWPCVSTALRKTICLSQGRL